MCALGTEKETIITTVTSHIRDLELCFLGIMYGDVISLKNAHGRQLARQALAWMCCRLMYLFANHNVIETDIILCIYIATISPRTSKDSETIT